MAKIVVVSPIPILAEEVHSFLQDHNTQKRVYRIREVESDIIYDKNDIVMIDIHAWSGRLVLTLKKLQASGVKIIIWFDSSRKDTASSFLKEGFNAYLPHHRGKEALIRVIDTIESGSYYIHDNLIDILYSDFLKKIKQPQPRDTLDINGSLTRREREILRQMAEGHSNETISQHLHLSINTVKNHVSAILKKLQVTNRNEAVIKVIRRDPGSGIMETT